MDQLLMQQKILEFRQRVLSGEQLSENELREAVQALRAKRQLAAEMAGTKRSSTKVVVPTRSAEDLKALFGAPVTTKEQ
jgi:hypothetical protein